MRIIIKGLTGPEEWQYAHLVVFGCPRCPYKNGLPQVQDCTDLKGVVRLLDRKPEEMLSPASYHPELREIDDRVENGYASST